MTDQGDEIAQTEPRHAYTGGPILLLLARDHFSQQDAGTLPIYGEFAKAFGNGVPFRVGVNDETYRHFLEPKDLANQGRIHDYVGSMSRDDFKDNLKDYGWIIDTLKDALLGAVRKELGVAETDEKWYGNVKAIMVPTLLDSGILRAAVALAFPKASCFTLNNGRPSVWHKDPLKCIWCEGPMKFSNGAYTCKQCKDAKTRQ